MSQQRLPDFLILGPMKSGSTSLFRWLRSHPGVAVPAAKEIRFFSDDAAWAEGIDGYARLFADLDPALVSGEASPTYSDPACSERTAARIQSALPHARLIFLDRDPVLRLRSHYRHQVQRGRETRMLPEALADPQNPYVRRSLYAEATAPYLDLFPRDQLLVADFDALFTQGEEHWHELLAFLGLPAVPRPTERHNVGAEKAGGFTPLMSRIYDRGLHGPLSRLPHGVRRRLKPLAFRNDGQYAVLLASSRAEIPEAIADRLAESHATFSARIGR